MHKAAMEYVERWATTDPIRVLDIGGRNVNGSPRPLFPNAHYWSIDLVDGPGVDAVADATIWRDRNYKYDLVICCEVFEHTPSWPQILWTAWVTLRDRGRLVVTCAGPGRAPHCGIDGRPGRNPDEWYCNIEPMRIVDCLSAAGWFVEECYQVGDDVQATAVKYE